MTFVIFSSSSKRSHLSGKSFGALVEGWTQYEFCTTQIHDQYLLGFLRTHFTTSDEDCTNPGDLQNHCTTSGDHCSNSGNLCLSLKATGQPSQSTGFFCTVLFLLFNTVWAVKTVIRTQICRCRTLNQWLRPAKLHFGPRNSVFYLLSTVSALESSFWVFDCLFQSSNQRFRAWPGGFRPCYCNYRFDLTWVCVDCWILLQFGLFCNDYRRLWAVWDWFKAPWAISPLGFLVGFWDWVACLGLS